MKFKKILRFVSISLLALIVAVIIFLSVSIAPTDRTFSYAPLLDTMTNRIAAVDEAPVPSPKGFRVGFSKVNLTPDHPVALGGYGKRRGQYFESVHDSIYVRSIVIDNGIERVAIVSADLLFIPPTVTAVLETELKEIGFSLDNTYMTATHSHNSIGSWGEGALASVLYGSYDDSVVHFIAEKIKAGIVEAARTLIPSVLKSGSIPIPDLVYNRVTDGGPVDPLLRAIEINRSDSSKLLVLSYTAHATCLFSRDLQLSGDYPGKLTQMLESKGYLFAMFMAGAVGSHGPQAPEGGWSCIDWMADHITESLLVARDQLKPMEDAVLEMHRVALNLPSPRPKILSNWSLRPWLFKSAFGDYPAFLTVLRMGDVVMLGTPCDFSGEFSPSLDSIGSRYQVMPMVTSFNGAYIGYVTPSKYFDVNHSETRLMNWFSPGNGEYVEQSLEKLLINVAQ